MDINNEIAKLDWKREPYGLYEPIEYTLAAGGKRVRPQLAMIASRMFGGKDEEVLPAALALEVFHNFTLLHDDVMDKADVRRGRPTVHVKWNENTAILSGDQMLIEAYKLLSGVPADKLPKVLQFFNQMATEICEGQQYDVDFESQEHVTIEDYLKMIRLKTSVLLANALQIGAYIAGADTQAQEALYQFGIHIGLAFQIQDDILDVWGDPKTFGKAVGGDISCNKKTFVYLEAKRRGGDEVMRQGGDEAMRRGGERLEEWYSQVLEDNTEKIAAVKEIFEQLDVRTACEKVVEDYTRKALALLEQLPQNEATEQLRQLANKLNTRKD
jgi:geranylgeranyl diphosphate synthase type II